MNKRMDNIRLFLKKYTVPIGLLPIFMIIGVLFWGGFIGAILQSLGWFPVIGLREITLKYYSEIFLDMDLWSSSGYTLYIAIIPTILAACISILLAITVNDLSGNIKKISSFIIKIPIMIPYLVGIYMIIIMYGQSGWIARILASLGLIKYTSQFPAILYGNSAIGIIMVYLWKQVPFMTTIIRSNLISVGRDYEQVAQTLGANSSQIFRYVTFPLIIPGILSSSLLVFAFNFGSFETPFIVGRYYPNTLPVEAYKLYSNIDLYYRPKAMALVILISILSTIILYYYEKSIDKFKYIKK